MKKTIAFAATGFAALFASTAAMADGHTDVATLTCADFSAMEISDQESTLTLLAAAIETRSVDELDIGEVEVLCNGSEEENLKMVVETEME